MVEAASKDYVKKKTRAEHGRIKFNGTDQVYNWMAIG